MSNIKLFESKHIRSIWDDKAQRWLFAVVDVVAALTDSQNHQVYWRVLKKRLLAKGNESVTNCNALKMTAPVVCGCNTSQPSRGRGRERSDLPFRVCGSAML